MIEDINSRLDIVFRLNVKQKVRPFKGQGCNRCTKIHEMIGNRPFLLRR